MNQRKSKNSKDYPLVSVVVLNFNGKEYLDTCLRSVLHADYPSFEVVFVDNGSEDGSYDYVKENFGCDSRMRLVRTSENKGFAEGNNVGIQHTKGELIAFLNNDTETDKNWLKELVNAILLDSSIGVVQSKLLSYHDPDILDCVGGVLDIFGNAKDAGRTEKEEGQYDEIREIFYACFAATLVKREVLKKVGLLDPRFFVYFEDADFCWRARLSGYKVMYIPKSKVYHIRGATAKRVSRLGLFHKRKNKLAILIINHELGNLLKTLPVVISSYFVGFFFGVVTTRKLDTNFTFAEAILWNLKNLRYLLSRRRCVRKIGESQHAKITDLMYKGNLLIEKLVREGNSEGFFG
jgi:GT2 family glycosyltransferase